MQLHQKSFKNLLNDVAWGVDAMKFVTLDEDGWGWHNDRDFVEIALKTY